MLVDGTTLVACKEELTRLALADGAIESVDFDIARPGDSLRAAPVIDIVEPRAKAPGSSSDWPGILSAPRSAGVGTTHVFEGAAVTILREDSPGESRGAFATAAQYEIVDIKSNRKAIFGNRQSDSFSETFITQKKTHFIYRFCLSS